MANGRGGGRRKGAHASTAALHPKNSIGVSFSGVDIETLNIALEQGIQEKVLRSAARAGIVVFYNEMRLRVPFATGQLHDSIYQWHDSNQSTQTRQTYASGPNKRKAPHWHQIEFGNRNRPAHPFIRPSFLSKLGAANEAARAKLSERMKQLLKEMNS